MALAFNKAKGSAKKSSIEQFQYKNGDNKVRMFGDILPRYIYWIKGLNDKNIPFECLAFNRETESFDNKDTDHVPTYFPDIKCGWSYSIQCIDPTDGKVKVLNLKKKLLEQVMVAAEDLGDPTDPETGWSICFKRTKTGPMAYNVEYQLQPLKCKPTPLTDAEKELVAAAPSIDDIIIRPTAEKQKELLEKIVNNEVEETSADDGIEDEFDIK